MANIKPDIAITDLPDASPSDPLEALSWLGDTVEEIAEGLRARGIKGTQFESDACPLAKYLQIWWSDARLALGVYWCENTIKPNFTKTNRIPDACAEFENEFDDGSFPDLIDNG